MTSQTADHILWSRVTAAGASPSITFVDITSPRPLEAAVEYVQSEPLLSAASSKPIVVAVGRARRLAVESHASELRDIATHSRAQNMSALRKTVGDVASAFIIASPHPLLVVQASAADALEV